MASIVTILTVILNVWFAYLEAFYRLFFPLQKKDVRGKVVLVTGAGRGIGKCLATQFAQLGCKLVLWDINEEDVKETADEICSQGGEAHAYQCDVSDYDKVKQTAIQVKLDVNHVDIVVNNAGIMLTKRFLDLTEKDVRRVFDINTLAHFWINLEFLAPMLEKNEGHIVTMSSMAGKAGGHLLTDYCASKHAVVGYSEALAAEIRMVYKKPGVKVTTIYPMFVNTDLYKQHDDRICCNTGGETVMEPTDVAADIIDGVLRNKVEVYIPAKVSAIGLLKLILPFKVQAILAEAIGVGYFEKTKTQ